MKKSYYTCIKVLLFLLSALGLTFKSYGQTDDYGDAPSSYNSVNPAHHTIVSNLYMGTNSPDAEFAPFTSLLADGDNTNGTNDEDAVSRLPLIYTISPNAAFQANNVANNTGATARLVAWIDFNHDGDFDDAGEQSQIVPVPSNTAAQSYGITWSGLTPSMMSPGSTYLRVRLTLDSSSNWFSSPLPNGGRASGEVEDYQVTIIPLAAQVPAFIDSLNVLEFSLANQSTGYNAYHAGNVSNIVGGERDVRQTITGAFGTVFAIGNGTLTISNNFATSSVTVITYDGTDHDPTTLNPTGLNGIDISAGGYMAMNYGQDLNDGDDTIIIRIYTDATHWSQIKYGGPNTGSALIRLFFPFSSFSTGPGASGPVDLKKVGAIQIVFDAAIALDVAIESVEFPQPKRDYGDARSSYDAGLLGPASHLRTDNLKLGALVDTNAGPLSALAATGDDLSGQDDEDAITTFPVISRLGTGASIQVNNVTNLTDRVAACVGWIDFNNDGDFDDANERSGIVSVNPLPFPTNVTLTWSGLTASQIVAARTNMRIRITTDNAPAGGNNWFTSPMPGGYRADGEVEDYLISIMQADAGDALAYPSAQCYVNCDENNDGVPDAAGSVWLGDYVDGEVISLANTGANGDDNDNIDDEDGIRWSNPPSVGFPITFFQTANHQGSGNDAATIGIWVDWNGNGSFNDASDYFSTGTVNFTGPGKIITNLTTTVPSGLSANFGVRAAIAPMGSVAYTKNYTFSGIQSSGEFEDYTQSIIPLPLGLVSFDAQRAGNTSLLNWSFVKGCTPATTEVTRSGDGTAFTSISSVKSIDGIQNYSFTDDAPLPGTNYYRLRIAEVAGESKLSNTAEVHFNTNNTGIWAQGQQSAISLRISGLSAGANYCICDVKGQIIGSGRMENGSVRNVAILNAGLYIVRFTDNNGRSLDRISTIVY